MVSKKTKQWAPLVGVHRRRAVHAGRAARSPTRRAGRALTKLQTALSLLRNYSPDAGAGGLPPDRPAQEVRQAERRPARRRSARSDTSNRKADEWLVLFVAGMWFQDLWTYDFRRTEMCIIPYATQMGEISFCAYNTGVGWRQIVEKMYQNATVAEWYKEHGKHAVYANPRKAVRCRRRPAGRAEDSARRAPRRLGAAAEARTSTSRSVAGRQRRLTTNAGT